MDVVEKVGEIWTELEVKGTISHTQAIISLCDIVESLQSQIMQLRLEAKLAHMKVGSEGASPIFGPLGADPLDILDEIAPLVQNLEDK